MTTPISRAAVLEILRTPAASDTFLDMIRRVEALEGCGVQVKALEWEDFEGLGAKASGFYQANYLIQKWSGEGRFEVAMSYPGYQTGYDGPRWHPTLESAKAAAQADYEARILSALEPVAQPETPIPGQFETMCLAIEDVIAGRGFDVDPWQPIETAPKDGTKFLAYEGRAENKRYECWWQEDFSNWSGWQDWWDSEPEPTHWQPLTKPGETTSAIPEEVKAYLRNALVVGGWRGERVAA